MATAASFSLLFWLALLPAPLFALISLDVPILHSSGLGISITWNTSSSTPPLMDVYFIGWVTFLLAKNVQTSQGGANISYFDFVRRMPGGLAASNTFTCHLEAFRSQAVDVNRSFLGPLIGLSDAFTEIRIGSSASQTQTQTPTLTSTSTPTTKPTPPVSHAPPKAAIIGGTVGGFFLLALLSGLGIVLCCRYRKRRTNRPNFAVSRNQVNPFLNFGHDQRLGVKKSKRNTHVRQTFDLMTVPGRPERAYHELEEARGRRETYQMERMNGSLASPDQGQVSSEAGGLEMLRLQVQQINTTIIELQQQATVNPPPDYMSTGP